MKKNLFNAIQTLLVFSLAITLTSCWNFDNPLEDMEGSGGGGGTDPSIKATSITLSETTLNKKLGDAAVTLTATVKPDDATDKSLTWSSSKESVATVADGVVTFVGAGTAIITAEAKDGSGVKATCEVTVKTPGLLAGKFTINAGGDQVQFSQGNLRYTSGAWSFFDNQYDYLTTFDYNSCDKFGWVGTTSVVLTSAPDKYGIETSNLPSKYGTSTTDTPNNWGETMGTGWRALTGGNDGEWKYLFDTRTTTSGIRYAKAKVNDKNGVILLPDDWDDSYYALASTNTASVNYTTNAITSDDWTNMLEAHGAVFLPAAGDRDGLDVINCNVQGFYWSSSPYGSDANFAYGMNFDAGDLNPAVNFSRYVGFSVRLVRDVE